MKQFSGGLMSASKSQTCLVEHVSNGSACEKTVAQRVPAWLIKVHSVKTLGYPVYVLMIVTRRGTACKSAQWPARQWRIQMNLSS